MNCKFTPELLADAEKFCAGSTSCPIEIAPPLNAANNFVPSAVEAIALMLVGKELLVQVKPEFVEK
jgi:hypothetical protein